MRFIIFILFLGPMGIHSQSDDLPFQWLLELTDSLTEQTQFCTTCETPPSIQQFYTPQRQLQFRLNYICSGDSSASYIFNATGAVLAKCVIFPDFRECDSGQSTAFTGFTFGLDIRTIWSCNSTFDCKSQNELKLFKPYEIVTSRIDCALPDRKLSINPSFPITKWIGPDNDTLSGINFIARSSSGYTVLVQDENGCLDTTEINIALDSFEIPIIGSSVICDNSGTRVSSFGYSKYAWSTGANDSTTVFQSGGNQRLIATDGIGCMDTVDFFIQDNRNRSVEIIVDQDPIFVGKSFEADVLFDNFVSSDVTQFNWTSSSGVLSCTNCMKPVVSISDESIVSVYVIDNDGCAHTDSLYLQAISAYKEVYSANVFSPNGDGVNDHFMLQSIEGAIRINRFIIFDRWGNSVYSAGPHDSGDSTFGWDGLFKSQPAPTGSYAWIAEVEYTDGSSDKLTGTILLTR